jgi:hypothetical protein
VSSDFTIKQSFLKEAANKIKIDEFELQKEENIDMTIDLYGGERQLFT